jgi:hypothetical protein
MKTLLSIFTLVFFTSFLSFAKEGPEEIMLTDMTYYGLGMSQINTGTGHGNGYAISGHIMKGRKSIEAGLIYSERESKFAGADFKYKVYFGNINRLHSDTRIFTPYIQYNLVYQKGLSTSPDIVQLGEKTVVIENTEPGIIATVGHYVMYGNKLKIMGNAYIESSIGFGVYQGSLDKLNGPGTFGIHEENHGFTYSFKLGFGYTFK